MGKWMISYERTNKRSDEITILADNLSVIVFESKLITIKKITLRY